jgi:hypothetical protein
VTKNKGFSAMPSLTLGGVRRRGLAISAAFALALGLAAAPARAGDDGEAPLWVGIGSTLGLDSIFGAKSEDKSATIEYRDRAKLVVPPKIELPPPVASPPQANAAWPRDPDVERKRKEKAEAAKPVRVFGEYLRRLPPPVTGDVVTMSATAGQGPGQASGQRACNSGPGVVCPTSTPPTINWNPLTWVGLEKKPETVLGPEPDRDWLTDPPKGYREPVEGEGARVAN